MSPSAYTTSGTPGLATPTRLKPHHSAFILMIDLLWAVNMIAIKESVDAIPPMLAVALRYAVILVFCLPALKIIRGRMKLLLLTAMVTGALQFGLGGYSFYVANNIGALAIAAQAGVPLSLLFAVLFDGERIHWRRTLGILLALSGIIVLLFDPKIVDERMAILFTIAGAVCFAAGSLMFRRLADVPVFTTYAWQSLVSLPLLLLASAMLEPGAFAGLAEVRPGVYGWIFYSAVGSSLIGHVGMSWLLQRYPVALTMPLTLLVPLLGVVITSLYYRTPITPMMILGGAITLAGVAIIVLRSVRKVQEAKVQEATE